MCIFISTTTTTKKKKKQEDFQHATIIITLETAVVLRASIYSRQMTCNISNVALSLLTQLLLILKKK